MTTPPSSPGSQTTVRTPVSSPPRKTLIQRADSFGDTPPAVKGSRAERSEYSQDIIKTEGRELNGRGVTGGRRSQQRLYATHRDAYAMILAEHKAALITDLNIGVRRLEDLKRRVRVGDPTKTAARNLSSKRVPTKEAIVASVAGNGSSASKIALLDAAIAVLEGEIEKIRAIQTLKELPKADSTNFAVADAVFLITTKSPVNGRIKELHISLPINVWGEDEELPNARYNAGDLRTAAFKRFFGDYLEEGQHEISELNLGIMGRGSTLNVSTCTDGEYPQIAFHSEKFLYYWLLHGGIEELVYKLEGKGITPENIFSVDGFILRMHSTKEMCDSCEVLTAGIRMELLVKLNHVLEEVGLVGVTEGSKVAIEMSADYQSTRDFKKEKLLQEDNFVGVRLQNVRLMPEIEKLWYDAEIARAHEYTVFTSGGTDKKKQETTMKLHERGIKTVQRGSRVVWELRETIAATKIQRWWRGIRRK